MSTRREFLRTLAVGTVALMVAPRLLSSPPKAKTLWDYLEALRVRSTAPFSVLLGAEAMDWVRTQTAARCDFLEWNKRGLVQGRLGNMTFVYEQIPYRCIYGEKTSHNPQGRRLVQPFCRHMIPNGMATRLNPAWTAAQEEACFVWRKPDLRYSCEGCLFRRDTFEVVEVERGVDLRSNFFV